MKARIMIDATSTSIGGGYTYLVNVIPGVCRRSPESRFRLLLRNAKLADAMPDLPNLPLGRKARRRAFSPFLLPSM